MIMSAVAGTRRAVVAVGAVAAFGILLILQYAMMIALWIRAWSRRLRHRMMYVPLNSAKGYAAVVALKESTGHIVDVPPNVALAVLENTVDMDELAKVIVWCMVMGVRTVTVYDVNGITYKNLSQLQDAVQGALLECRSSKDAVMFIQEENQNILEPQTKDSALRVYVITAQHGKGGLASAMRAVCQDYAMGRIQDNQITQKMIEEELRRQQKGMPEPEVVLRFGNDDAVMGFLPWQINHSEMLDILSLKGVLASEFVQVLEKYGKTEKRFGK
ncbi:dehydrodolichyl diphosphate synthase complex subunit Nus1-like [Ornithodoros turicata]|uniref:dehydrodolichyl diphosphate synthase complex subunit Nus1-like n=1 Tax=Ornithodoros turicata TaxID=34597 RepID=UPI003139CDA1